MNVSKVGSVTFGNGTTWNHEVCDHMDSGTHTDVQNYCQSVSLTPKVSRVKTLSSAYVELRAFSSFV